MKVAQSLSETPEVLDVYEVTGDYDIIAIVASEDINQLRGLLKDKVLKTEGIKSSVTTIVLQTHKRT
jgi:DNA-binding Lrp family transcriptional regulator